PAGHRDGVPGNGRADLRQGVLGRAGRARRRQRHVSGHDGVEPAGDLQRSDGALTETPGGAPLAVAPLRRPPYGDPLTETTPVEAFGGSSRRGLRVFVGGRPLPGPPRFRLREVAAGASAVSFARARPAPEPRGAVQ